MPKRTPRARRTAPAAVVASSLALLGVAWLAACSATDAATDDDVTFALRVAGVARVSTPSRLEGSSFVAESEARDVAAPSAGTPRVRVDLALADGDATGIVAPSSGGLALRVRRHLASAGSPRVAHGAIALRGASAGLVVFGTARGVEELVVLDDDEARVTYELETPSGWTTSSDPDGGSIVEVRDPRGVARLRLRADQAWDAAGHALRASLVADGASFRVVARGATAWPVVVDPAWELTTDMAYARRSPSATPLPDGRVLVAGGRNDNGATIASAEIYDPASGTFTSAGSMHVARALHTATALSTGEVLLAGGETDENPGQIGVVDRAEIYDPRLGVFREIAPMPGPRARHTATRLPSGDVLLVGGGSSTLDPRAIVFDSATGAFAFGPALAAFRDTHTATLTGDGSVVVAGGWGEHGRLATVERYDASTRAFVAGGALLEPRWDHTATLLPNGEVLFVGGRKSGQSSRNDALASAEAYDPVTQTSRAVGSLHSARKSHEAILLPTGDVAVLGGAGDVAPIASTEVFDRSSGAFHDGPAMRDARESFSARLLDDGRVVSIGGASELLYALVSAERVDLRARSFEPSPIGQRGFDTASLVPTGEILVVGNDGGALVDPTTGTSRAAAGVHARVQHTATPLADGRVLLLGGFSEGVSSAPAEIYDARANTTSVGPAMLHARVDHTATLLADGRVLVVGGYGAELGTEGIGAVEVFDPVANRFTEVGALATPRYLHTATRLADGRVLIAGSDSFPVPAEVFDPVRGTLSPVGVPKAPRFNGTATLLADGRVLFVGGASSVSGIAVQSEWFDPKSGQFALTPSRIAPRSFHTATPLPDGDVLIAGGESGIGVSARSLTTTVIYDAVSGDLRDGPPMRRPRRAHRAVLAPSGDVILLGGNERRGTAYLPVDTVERFTTPAASLDLAPTIAVSAPSLAGGEALLLRGHLTPGGERNGGQGASSAPSPALTWMPLEGGGPLRVALRSFRDVEATASIPATPAAGPGLLFGSYGGAVGRAAFLSIAPAVRGAACAAKAACKSGSCVDGVCCDTACDGTCFACSRAAKGGGDDGVCGPVAPTVDAHADCSVESPATCGRTGQCDGAGLCATYGADVACGAGGHCSAGLCVATAGVAACESDTVWTMSGARRDCAPYRCSASASGAECLTSCTSHADCAEGRACDVDHVCVPALAEGPAPASGGCSASPAPRRGTHEGPLLSFAALALVLARRRRASRRPAPRRGATR